MPDTKQVIKDRSARHSDVATSAATKRFLPALTERQFGSQLLKAARAARAGLVLRNFREEWLSTDDGIVLEMCVEAETAE